MAAASAADVGVLLGNGTGTLDPPARIDIGSRPASVAVGDFDADGKADVVTADYAGATVSVLPGGGGGTFRPPLASPAGTSPTGVAVGDFNGDGRPDAALANYGSNDVSVLLNDGARPAPGLRFVTVGDVTVTTYQANKLLMLRERQGGLAIPVRTFERPMGLAADARRIALGTRDQV